MSPYLEKGLRRSLFLIDRLDNTRNAGSFIDITTPPVKDPRHICIIA